MCEVGKDEQPIIIKELTFFSVLNHLTDDQAKVILSGVFFP